MKRQRGINLPAIISGDVPKLGLVFAGVGIVQHVLVVRVVTYVLVFGDQGHVEDTYVDLEARLSHPEKVGGLSDVCDVVGGLQIPRAVKVLEKHIVRGLHLEPCKTEKSEHKEQTAPKSGWFYSMF